MRLKRTMLAMAGLWPLLALGAPSADAPASLALEDETVSARHREEPRSAVPLPLGVVDGSAFGEAGYRQLPDLQQRAAAFQAAVPNARFASYSLRGLGGNAHNDGLEGSVGVFLDGVYLARQGMALLDLPDLERIEVLRGPQGTLLGKNTTAGAVNLVSRAPGFAPAAEIEWTLGQHGLQQTRGSVEGALVDEVLAARLSFSDLSRDGLVDNREDGSTLGGQQRRSGRGQLLWTPNPDFSARVSLEQGRQDEDGHAFTASHYSAQTRARMAFVGYTPLPVDPWRRQVRQDAANRTRVEQDGVTLQLDRRWAGGAQLTSLTGYRDWRYTAALDADGEGLAVATTRPALDHRQFSQELRLTDALGEHLDYLVGAYYLRQHLDRQVRVGFGADAAAYFLGDRPEVAAYGLTAAMIPPSLLDGAVQHMDGAQTGETRALFGQLRWRPTERLEVTPGLRYTQERKRGWLTRRVSGLAPLPSNPLDPLTPVWQWGGQLLRDTALGGDYRREDRVADNDLSGELGLAYRFQPDLLGFLRVSRGFKAGGINLEIVDPQVPTTFDAERATAYDLGLRRVFGDGRARLDLTLYQTDVDDYQALTNSPPVSPVAPPLRDRLVNVGKVRLRGVELEGALRASTRLDLSLGLAWSEARYRSFREAPCAPEVRSWACDRSGERLYGAPEWSLVSGADYHRPLVRGLEGFAGLDYRYRSAYQMTLEGGPGSTQDAEGLVDARLGVRRPDGGWEVMLWGRNLFDRPVLEAVYGRLGAGDYGAIAGDPRTLGVTLRARY